jgi:hypothetical protein
MDLLKEKLGLVLAGLGLAVFACQWAITGHVYRYSWPYRITIALVLAGLLYTACRRGR